MASALAIAESDLFFEIGIMDHALLSDKDKRRLKIADMVELCIFCKEEISRGNDNFYDPLDKGRSVVQELVLELQDETEELYTSITALIINWEMERGI